MRLLSVPNVSEARDSSAVDNCSIAIKQAGARLLDVHSDAAHNRTVFTVSGTRKQIVSGMTRLAAQAQHIDLERHTGVHPRLGGLDVCPIVAHEVPMNVAVDVAREVAHAICEATGLPVYLYGEAATRPETRELPGIRRGGLATLIERAQAELPPDLGSSDIDPRRGVVCVGARGVLIAFNVWLECDAGAAATLAASIRSSGGGPPGVRALGFPMKTNGQPLSQVSMNLLDPAVTGIDEAFDALREMSARLHLRIAATEIVGLVPERYLPDPKKEAARLLTRPGRSLESALGD